MPTAVPEGYPEAPSWLAEVPLAHRGLHDRERPENSLPAFAAAAAAGYGVELDVRLSADRVPMVCHDGDLERLTGVAVRVGELPATELARLRLLDTPSHVPTVAETLATLGDAPAMVELKQPGLRAGELERRTAAVLAEHPGPWCVASFNPGSVRWFRDHQPEAVRVLTASPLDGSRLPAVVRRRLGALRDLPSVLPHAVSYDLAALPAPAPARWRRSGGVLVTWTAVGDAEVQRARTLADNVIFEHASP